MKEVIYPREKPPRRPVISKQPRHRCVLPSLLQDRWDAEDQPGTYVDLPYRTLMKCDCGRWYYVYKDSWSTYWKRLRIWHTTLWWRARQDQTHIYRGDQQ